MKQTKRILGILLAIVLMLAMFAPVAFAETEDPQPTDTAEPTQTATAEPTQTATPTPTQKPTQKPTPTPTPTATPTPTQAPTQEPAPSASEAQDINLTIYVYTQEGKPAEGYSVIIDKSSQTANKDGMVSFPGVTVETHNISVKDASGKLSTGMLYLSRGNTTGITEQAMGGKYSISVGQDVTNVYLGATYVPEEAVQIYSAGTSRPNPPEVTATTTPIPATGSFNVTASFKDSADKAVTGAAVTVVESELPTPAVGVTDGSGKFVFNNAAFKTYVWTILAPGATEDSATVMNIEFRQGTQAKIAETTGEGYVVEMPSTAKDLYMDFKQDASGKFVLDKVSDQAPSGISSMLVGIIAMIVIIVIVVIIIVVVNRNRKKKRTYQAKQNEFRGREKDFEEPKEEFKEPEGPKRTGGTNKFDDRSRF
ncbi:MAG: carboxypeptidase-like regulatory domain-containing protein [Christensenella sp.]|uniref:carboxypeptidase-like regulatory domain-containing protein n=1 Tax=Christensenella sp. TaxID=1935934 RepID=UPI002B20F85B|nr:carboxypeptidase-like regulatory domain-containing protein [Christensenella sp.]MEA5004018.1 carboxypeptidase-like regulatory domain-containing protein [Christensenella sp.]